MQELTHQVEVGEIAWQHTLALRHEVLKPEKSPSECQVEGDEEAVHFGAFLDDRLIGIVSTYIEGDRARLRHLATHPDFQHRGVASALLSYVTEELQRMAINLVWCDSQKEIMGFYQHIGFNNLGDQFLKNDVEYYKLCMILPKIRLN